jgi:uncharacterized membrane protein
MVVCAIVVFAVIVGVLVALARSHPLPGRVTPEDLLKERLARGEMDRVEYEQSLDALYRPRSTTTC